jgi:hypothetical protein
MPINISFHSINGIFTELCICECVNSPNGKRVGCTLSTKINMCHTE